MEILKWFITILTGYFLGCVNGAIIISKHMMKDDIRSHGSGNAGLTNFFRTYGGFQTLLVLAIDVFKTVLACLIGWWLLGTWEAKMLAGVAVMVGHCLPVTSRFKGGKGILCGLSVAIMMDWRVAVIILFIFITLVALTRFVSLGSIAASVAFVVSFWIFYSSWPIRIAALVGAAVAIWLHRPNMKRLLAGTEHKLTFHKKK